MSEEYPPLTPEETAQYDAISQKCLDEIIESANSTNWTESKKDGGVTFYTRKVKTSSFDQVKSETSIPVPIEQVIEYLGDCPDITPQMTAEERDGTVERTLYRVCGDKTYDEGILYLALESPSRLVTARDFLMYRKHYQKDDIHYFTQVSIENDKIRPPTKNFVRGQILFQGYVVDKDPEHDGNIRIRFVVHADPKGSIPGWVYNQVALGQGYAVKKLKDTLEKPKQ